MEEILASIRRIIADDQDSVKTPNPTRPPVVLAPVPEFGDGDDDEDVLDLAGIAPPPAKSAPVVPLDLDVADVDFREVQGDATGFHPVGADKEPEPEPARPPRREPPPILRRAEPPLVSNQDHLISSATDATVGQAFNLLASTVLGSNNTRTLEDLVREMLRPMLKDWLDDNLPTIVERLVRAEIERVARGK